MHSGLYITYLGVPDNSILQKELPALSGEVQVKVTKSRILIDKWRHLLSDLLIRNVIAQELATAPDSIAVESDSYGKPILANRSRHFNISHSHNIIILATDDTPVGVDIEYIKPFSDLDSIITQFTQEEQQMYYAKYEEQRVGFFYELWTLKESYLKAIGKGLNCSLQSFSIRITDNEASLSRGIDPDIAWFFQRYTIDNQYQCAVCSRRGQFPKKALILKPCDLLKH
ncbi:MAG TPA: 4'-phosphopantetheinyl transferase superfamily protein [Chlamydiales bacterium]|nr:4'-phosphopantetheinyl transferase superfamily protein [Chlamydiales bacterium]